MQRASTRMRGRAWVAIGRRGPERLVLKVQGTTATEFEPSRDEDGQGLGNMRPRAAAIGGAFSLRTSPGRGTALEVVFTLVSAR